MIMVTVSVVIWVVGSSVLYWSIQRTIRRSSVNLGLDKKHFNIKWTTRSGMAWDEVFPSGKASYPPDMIVVHFGGNLVLKVYMFSYFLGHGSEPAQAWLELMHNGVKINAAITDTFHTNEDLQGGNFAILCLNAGDSVWVESWHQNDAYIDGPYGFTSFSGALLY